MKFLSCLLILITSTAFAGEQLSEKLIELRAQVQSEADQLDAQKKSLNASIQSLTVEKGELESRKKLLSLQNNQIKNTLNEKIKIIGGEETEELKGYVDLVDTGFTTLLNNLDEAVPFKALKRKDSIKSLQEKYKNKEITVAEYFEKYWLALQNEIRLSESVEIQNDNIMIDQNEHQVKVLKFGMVQMYFKTLDNKIGTFVKKDKVWEASFINDKSASKGVSLLFEAKEKQVKGGNYNLPLFVDKKLLGGANVL